MCKRFISQLCVINLSFNNLSVLTILFTTIIVRNIVTSVCLNGINKNKYSYQNVITYKIMMVTNTKI